MRILVLLCLTVTAVAHEGTPPRRPHGLLSVGPKKFDPSHLVKSSANRDGVLTKEPVKMCDEKFRDTTLDHFAWDKSGGEKTFRQRYFFCDKHWSNHKGKRGPIFVYTGNESDVTLYVNATGLMWESAKEFGALLLFIEHRYYGKSLPFGKDYVKHMGYLTTEQAMADYIEVLYDLKEEYSAKDSAVIGFGGSLGGMYCAWMRMKYPHAIDGVIAASAPIWSFMGEDPPYTPNGFARIATFDCTEEAGSAAECVPNFRKFWPTIRGMAHTEDGRRMVAQGRAKILKSMGFCDNVSLKTSSDAERIIGWVRSAISSLAMGSYSFPSGYMIDGDGLLPAYPIRVSCDYLSEPLDGHHLLKAVGQAAGVYYNYSHDMECFDYHKPLNEAEKLVDDNWMHQFCTEMFLVSAMDGVTDMYWDDPWNPEDNIQYCREVKKVTPRPYWATQQWGGKDIDTASNIVFSNGQYDPWSAGGVLEDINESVVALIVEEGGHHADLMFSNKHDSESLKKVRKAERKWIQKWIDEKAKKVAKRSATHADAGSGPRTDRVVVT